MDPKTEIMIALGTAVGANCIPCFHHLYSRTQELNLEESEIREVVEIASKVKNGAWVFMKNTITEVLGEIAETEQPCCSSSAGSCR